MWLNSGMRLQARSTGNVPSNGGGRPRPLPESRRRVWPEPRRAAGGPTSQTPCPSSWCRLTQSASLRRPRRSPIRCSWLRLCHPWHAPSRAVKRMPPPGLLNGSWPSSTCKSPSARVVASCRRTRAAVSERAPGLSAFGCCANYRLTGPYVTGALVDMIDQINENRFVLPRSS